MRTWWWTLLPVAACGGRFDLVEPLVGECRNMVGYFVDSDGDGWGEPQSGVAACEGDASVARTARNGLDCDDGDPAVTMGGSLFGLCPQALLASEDPDGAVVVGGFEHQAVEYVVVAADLDAGRAYQPLGGAEVDRACALWGRGVAVEADAERELEGFTSPVGAAGRLQAEAVAPGLAAAITSGLGADVAEIVATVDVFYAAANGSTALDDLWQAGEQGKDGSYTRGSWTGGWRQRADTGSTPFDPADVGLAWCDAAPTLTTLLGDVNPDALDDEGWSALEEDLGELRLVLELSAEDGAWASPCVGAPRSLAVGEGGAATGRVLRGVVCEREVPLVPFYEDFWPDEIVLESATDEASE